MKELLDKLKIVVQSLEEKYGTMSFFALFLRENSFQKWDILVSASWLSSSENKSYERVISEIQSALGSDGLLQFARVVILDSVDPAVSFLQEVCPLTNGGFKEAPKDFSLESLSSKFGFVIERAYLLRCQKS